MEEAELQSKLTDLEGHLRENARIYATTKGLKAPRSGILCVCVCMRKLLKENLGIPCTKDLQIERAHCALAPQPLASAQPRSILEFWSA